MKTISININTIVGRVDITTGNNKEDINQLAVSFGGEINEVLKRSSGPYNAKVKRDEFFEHLTTKTHNAKYIRQMSTENIESLIHQLKEELIRRNAMEQI